MKTLDIPKNMIFQKCIISDRVKKEYNCNFSNYTLTQFSIFS